MMRKILLALVLIPLAIVIVALAVANRQPVSVSFDPFSVADPTVVLRLPLFELMFVLVIAGVIVGGSASWLRQGRWRRVAREREAELQSARNEVDRLRRELAARETASAAPLALRPPAA